MIVRPVSMDLHPVTLELKNVSLRVGAETHIYPASVTFADDGFNLLLGTTLAGKTTLMQLMAGLIKPTTGEIWFNGRNVTGMPVQKRNVSMVYQQFINYPNFSVFENIASPLRVVRMPKAEIEQRVGSMADLLRLTPMLQRKPSELSGGQQQRTALARALVKDADLVLLDEPLANLDFKLREELRDELPRLFADRRCTVVYATADPGEALLFGGHTAVLHEGRVVEYGPTGKLYRRPGDLQAAKVFSEPPINVAPVTKAGNQMRLSEGVVWTAQGDAANLADGRYIIGIRPHFVTPATSDAENGVAIEGRVQIAELSGSESVIHFDHAGEGWVSLFHGLRSFEIGETARFHFDPARGLYFAEDGQRLAGGEAS